MLEILITAGIVVGVIVGVFVGLVALFVFLAGTMGAAWWTLDKITSIDSKPWLPPQHQMQEVYKLYMQSIRDTAAYGAPLFGTMKEKDGS